MGRCHETRRAQSLVLLHNYTTLGEGLDYSGLCLLIEKMGAVMEATPYPATNTPFFLLRQGITV